MRYTRRRAGSSTQRARAALQPPVAGTARAAQRDEQTAGVRAAPKKCRPTRSAREHACDHAGGRARCSADAPWVGPAGRALGRGSRRPRRCTPIAAAPAAAAAGGRRWRARRRAATRDATRGRPDGSARAGRGADGGLRTPTRWRRRRCAARALRARAACVGTRAAGSPPRSRPFAALARQHARAIAANHSDDALVHALSDRHHRGGGREAAHPSHARGDRRQQAEARVVWASRAAVSTNKLASYGISTSSAHEEENHEVAAPSSDESADRPSVKA